MEARLTQGALHNKTFISIHNFTFNNPPSLSFYYTVDICVATQDNVFVTLALVRFWNKGDKGPDREMD